MQEKARHFLVDRLSEGRNLSSKLISVQEIDQEGQTAEFSKTINRAIKERF